MSDALATAPGPAAPPPAPAAADVPPGRLLVVLATGGALAGILLVVVFFLTLPAIEANRARDLEEALGEVLRGPERFDTLYVVGNALVREAPAGTDPRRLEKVFLGYGPGNRPVGFAMVVGEPGFQDVVLLIVGYDARERKILGMKVIESKETPGLGDKIQKDPAFVGQFVGAEPPLVGVKTAKRAGPREITMITGATISSRAVIRIINNAVKRLGPLMEAFPQESRG